MIVAIKLLADRAATEVVHRDNSIIMKEALGVTEMTTMITEEITIMKTALPAVMAGKITTAEAKEVVALVQDPVLTRTDFVRALLHSEKDQHLAMVPLPLAREETNPATTGAVLRTVGCVTKDKGTAMRDSEMKVDTHAIHAMRAMKAEPPGEMMMSTGLVHPTGAVIALAANPAEVQVVLPEWDIAVEQAAQLVDK